MSESIGSMAPDQERDGSDRSVGTSARMAGPSATTSSASVGGGAVAVVVASCPSPTVLQTSPQVVSAATASSASSMIATASASAVGALSASAVLCSSEDDDVVMSRGSERQWKRSVSMEERERLVDGMLEELQRITGQENVRHLRVCASRYESLVWKKSSNETEYTQKLERRIQSLRRQPSQQEIQVTAAAAAQQQAASAPRRSSSSSSVATTSASRSTSSRPSSSKRPKHRRSSHHRVSSSSPLSPSSSLSTAARDEQYFARLHIMKASYRDEVALVFRELCRVNTVIQNSASLRRHESNNLGDFLANLKKIIYLLEQRPDEMHGMIPARKRTLEYLDVVESHIQRKVLPILYRLRHTYSTILRPLVLNYLRNCNRVSRRL